MDNIEKEVKKRLEAFATAVVQKHDGEEETYNPELLKKIVKKISSKVRGFNDIYDLDDYMQEAYIALLESKDKYKFSTMKYETYAYWYIENRINRLADCGDIVYQIYMDGEHVRTLSSVEFRKQKRKLEQKGYTWRTTKVIEHLCRNDEDGNLKEVEIPYYDYTDSSSIG